MEPQQYPIKIAMIGESGVGKTSIISRYVSNSFVVEAAPTKGASFKTKILKTPDEGSAIKLMIWDTAGQEVYRSLAAYYYRNADVVVIVYDITNVNSFEAIDYWIKEVRDKGLSECLVAIVGNKCDSVAEEKVTLEEAKAKATANDATFHIVSAKENINVSEAFLDIALRKYPELAGKFGRSGTQAQSAPSTPATKETVKLKPTNQTAAEKEKRRKGCKC